MRTQKNKQNKNKTRRKKELTRMMGMGKTVFRPAAVVAAATGLVTSTRSKQPAKLQPTPKLQQTAKLQPTPIAMQHPFFRYKASIQPKPSEITVTIPPSKFAEKHRPNSMVSTIFMIANHAIGVTSSSHVARELVATHTVNDITGIVKNSTVGGDATIFFNSLLNVLGTFIYGLIKSTKNDRQIRTTLKQLIYSLIPVFKRDKTLHPILNAIVSSLESMLTCINGDTELAALIDSNDPTTIHSFISHPKLKQCFDDNIQHLGGNIVGSVKEEMTELLETLFKAVIKGNIAHTNTYDGDGDMDEDIDTTTMKINVSIGSHVTVAEYMKDWTKPTEIILDNWQQYRRAIEVKKHKSAMFLVSSLSNQQKEENARLDALIPDKPTLLFVVRCLDLSISKNYQGFLCGDKSKNQELCTDEVKHALELFETDLKINGVLKSQIKNLIYAGIKNKTVVFRNELTDQLYGLKSMAYNILAEAGEEINRQLELDLEEISASFMEQIEKNSGGMVRALAKSAVKVGERTLANLPTNDQFRKNVSRAATGQKNMGHANSRVFRDQNKNDENKENDYI